MLPDQCTRWVTGVIGPGSRVVSNRRLRLGSWHVNHALDVLDARGSTHRLVLRRWARPAWQIEDPDYTVEREARVLELLRSTQVSAPVVVASDPAGVHCDVPAILLTRLAGHPPRPADSTSGHFCAQLAEALAQVHEVHDIAAVLDEYDRAHAAPARWMPATPVWLQATAAVREPPPPTVMKLIHRDYHPENTLWSRGHPSGVVDWTQASWGPPGLDLGHVRWNLVADRGQQVADQFLDCYRAATGNTCDDQPYWDLGSLLDLLLDGDDLGDLEPRDLRRFEHHAKTQLTTNLTSTRRSACGTDL